MTEYIPPAPETDIIVQPGGNGNVFIRFAQDNRRVELLNELDAKELHDKLGEVINDD